MAFDRAAAEAVLQVDYLPTIRPQINNATPFLAETERNTEDVHGLEAHIALHLGRSEAVGNIGEHDDVPTAQFQRYDASKFFTRINVGTIALTQAVIESARGGKSYLTALDSEQKGITNELKENFGRQVVSNDDDAAGGTPPDRNIDVGGASGRLVTCGVTNNATEVVLDADVTTFRKLRKNMVIDIIDSTNDTVLAAARTVESVDRSAGTIEISGAAVTTSADHYVVRAGAYGKEMRGIQTVCKDDTELQGIDPADWDEWRASVLDNGGTARPFSEDLIQRLLDDVDAASGTQPDALLCEYTQERAIYAELQSMKRSVNRTDIKGGFTALSFNDRIPVLVDRQFRPDAIAAVNRKHMAIYETSDWSWNDADGHVLKWVPNKLKWTANLHKFADFGTDRRNAFGILTDLETA